MQTWLRDGAVDDAISSLVQTWLRRRRHDLFAGTNAQLTHACAPYWPAEHFGLQQAGVFANAAAPVQTKILWDCAHATLGEAVQIERAGIAYAAKMSLIADTTTERQLYGVFVADEVAHLESLKPFLASDAIEEDGPFLQLLSEVIETGSRTCLQYVVQVVLEGWGLTHYRKLRDACEDDALRNVFDRILSDEAAHHGSGVLLLDDRANLLDHKDEILRWMTRFLALVQMGPLSTLAAIEHQLGPLAPRQRRETLEEMGARTHSAIRLDLLRELMRKPKGGQELVVALESAGAFRPWSTTEIV